MELLRKITNFTKSIKDKTHIYKKKIRSVVEQSCVVCNENLSKQNVRELERVQKVAVNLLSGKYELYSEALKSIGIKP